MKTLLVTLGLAAAVLLAPRPGAAHWVSLAPPPYAYAQAYPYPYAYPAYPMVAVPAAPCVLGPTGPICAAGAYGAYGAYYPGWQYRREWDTDYIWRNTGPHVRGYSFH